MVIFDFFSRKTLLCLLYWDFRLLDQTNVSSHTRFKEVKHLCSLLSSQSVFTTKSRHYSLVPYIKIRIIDLFGLWVRVRPYWPMDRKYMKWTRDTWLLILYLNTIPVWIFEMFPCKCSVRLIVSQALRQILQLNCNIIC